MEEESLLPIDQKWLFFAFYLSILVWISYLIWEARQYGPQDVLFMYVIFPVLFVLLCIQLLKYVKPGLISQTRRKTSEAIQSVVPEFGVSETVTSDDGEGAREDLKQQVESATSGGNRSRREQHKYEIQMIGAVLLLGVGVYLIGLIYALPIFVFLFVLYYDRSILTAAGVTLVFSLIMYILFINLLSVVLWDGILDLPMPF